MIVSTDRRMTLAEYLEYDDGTDARYELVDGVLVEMGSEAPINSTIATFLIIQLAAIGVHYSRMSTKHDIAVSSSRATARQPDLIVHTAESAAAILSHGAKLLMPEMPAPALVVEVASNSDTDRQSRKRDYVEKRDEYAARGIPEYWIIDPIAQVVIVLDLVDGLYQAQEFQGTDRVVSSGFPALGLTAEDILASGEASAVE
jgi:Uma2 family endonuclease